MDTNSLAGGFLLGGIYWYSVVLFYARSINRPLRAARVSRKRLHPLILLYLVPLLGVLVHPWLILKVVRTSHELHACANRQSPLDSVVWLGLTVAALDILSLPVHLLLLYLPQTEPSLHLALPAISIVLWATWWFKVARSNRTLFPSNFGGPGLRSAIQEFRATNQN